MGWQVESWALMTRVGEIKATFIDHLLPAYYQARPRLPQTPFAIEELRPIEHAKHITTTAGALPTLRVHNALLGLGIARHGPGTHVFFVYCFF
jgi:hypothetical protein